MGEVATVNRKTKDINKVVEGLVITAEVSEGGVDSLCVQGWEEGLSMDLHLGIWAVEHLGWVRKVFICVLFLCCPIYQK